MSAAGWEYIYNVRICTAVLVTGESLALPSLCIQEQLLAGWEGQPDKAFAASIIQYDLHRGELAPTAVAASWLLRYLRSEVVAFGNIAVTRFDADYLCW